MTAHSVMEEKNNWLCLLKKNREIMYLWFSDSERNAKKKKRSGNILRKRIKGFNYFFKKKPW